MITTGERAAVAETEVGRALRRLPDGWVTLHDLAWPGRPGAALDHVVVGPGGVFVILAEDWAGTIEVRDQVLTQDGRSREQAVDLAARAAIAVQGVVPGRCFPVICFAAGAPLSGVARDVMICSSSTVLLKLRSLPHRLGPDDVRRCVAALETIPAHRATTARALRLRAKRREAPRRQPRPVLALVAMLELFLAIVLVLSGGMQQAADLVTRGFVVVTDSDDRPDTKPAKHKRDGDQRRQDKQP
ncbi:hypothetical protein GCM10023339_08390 [Alloalcanivorax gelatiniphagus]